MVEREKMRAGVAWTRKSRFCAWMRRVNGGSTEGEGRFHRLRVPNTQSTLRRGRSGVKHGGEENCPQGTDTVMQSSVLRSGV
eukprot:364481-Chlamydomonas_euryale.AAC.15